MEINTCSLSKVQFDTLISLEYNKEFKSQLLQDEYWEELLEDLDVS